MTRVGSPSWISEPSRPSYFLDGGPLKSSAVQLRHSDGLPTWAHALTYPGGRSAHFVKWTVPCGLPRAVQDHEPIAAGPGPSSSADPPSVRDLSLIHISEPTRPY